MSTTVTKTCQDTAAEVKTGTEKPTGTAPTTTCGKPLPEGFEDFDLDNIEVIESKIFA